MIMNEKILGRKFWKMMMKVKMMMLRRCREDWSRWSGQPILS